MDKKAKEGAPQIEIREFTDLRDVRPFATDRRYDGLPLRAILGIVRQKGLQKVGVDIADYDGAPAGCVAFQWNYRGDSRSCYLFALFVKPEFRRKGVAERLVKSFCDNYRKVVLGVEGGNEPAVRLYKKLGFEFTGENEPVEDKDIKVMERTKRFSIKFCAESKCFGIHAHRVKKLWKEVESDDPNEAAKIKQRIKDKKFFNKYTPRTKESKRSLAILKRDLLSRYMREAKRNGATDSQAERYAQREAYKEYNWRTVHDETPFPTTEWSNSLKNKYKQDAPLPGDAHELHNAEINERAKDEKERDSQLWSQMASKMRDEGIRVSVDPTQDAHARSKKKEVSVEFLSPAQLGHEWTHVDNVDVKGKGNYDSNLGVPSQVQSFIQAVGEERSANRGGVMKPYLNGASLQDLPRYHKWASISDKSFQRNLGPYVPQNLRYEMNEDAIKRMKRQQNKK